MSTKPSARKRARAIVGAWSVLIALIVPAAGRADQPFPARVLPHTMEVNAQYVAAEGNAALQDQHLEDMLAGGLRSVRSDLRWDMSDAEATPLDLSDYDWAAPNGFDYDKWIGVLAAKGMRWNPNLTLTPFWARTPCTKSDPSVCPPLPSFYSAFASFAAAAVDRYGPDGVFWDLHPELPYVPVHKWEIWNEPDLTWGEGCPLHTVGLDLAPQLYADFFMAALPAIKAADPGAEVLIGSIADIQFDGLHCNGPEFLEGVKLRRPEVFQQADAIGYHKYLDTPAEILARLDFFRDLLDHELGGAGLAIHMNEVGWSTPPGISSPNAPDPIRGQYIASTADAVVRSKCGVRSFGVYAWTESEEVPGGPAWYGIAHRAGGVKDAGVQYLAKVSQLQGVGTTAPDYTVFDPDGLCAWRPVPDIDEDGVPDPADPAPADPTVPG